MALSWSWRADLHFGFQYLLKSTKMGAKGYKGKTRRTEKLEEEIKVDRSGFFLAKRKNEWQLI